MINHYQFVSAFKEKFFWDVSVEKARVLFNDYNIIFTYYCPELPTHIQSMNYYLLDSDKSFDEQLQHIKTLSFPYQTKAFFHTDYKINKIILDRKIREAKIILDRKNQTYSVTNIHKETKIKKEIIRDHINEMIHSNQGRFDFE